MNAKENPGVLFVIATPIGNLEDMTFRAVRLLGEVDALACEDTRQTRKIFERFHIPSPAKIFSYHEHNAEQSGHQILHLLQQGASVGLCSDAGYPGISDPGYKIIADALVQGYRVEAIPGPNAVLTALVLSGLPTTSYTFKGFAPFKSGRRKKFIALEEALPHTLVFFESPHRIHPFLQDAQAVLGNRKGALCFEMTKKFEKIQRGFLEELCQQVSQKKPKGEITVVIAGNHPKFIQTAPP